MIAFIVIAVSTVGIVAGLVLRQVVRGRRLPGPPRDRQEIASMLEARRRASDSRHNTQSQPGVNNGGGFGF
jgi:hypothetical protein